MLKLVDRFGIEEVVLPFSAPLILATHLERTMSSLRWILRIRQAMTHSNLGCDLIETNATETTHRASEVFVNKIVRETNRFENLCPGVRGHCGDAHFGHDLQNTLARGLDVVTNRLDWIVHLCAIFSDEVFDRLKREVRIDGCSAVTDQETHVMHLSCVTSLDDQTNSCARLFADEVVVNSTCKEQRRNRSHFSVSAAIGKDKHGCPGLDRVRRQAPNIL
ncbi:unannotated protein [freshwater metagenome]|uniref:Unannotated protein n=1 Tax=freshwater metagenome TaxID=449393 RepID=A0A6J6KP89_9ZZZZ